MSGRKLSRLESWEENGINIVLCIWRFSIYTCSWGFSLSLYGCTSSHKHIREINILYSKNSLKPSPALVCQAIPLLQTTAGYMYPTV